MTRRSLKIVLTSLGAGALALLFFVHGCERVDSQTILFPPPLGNVTFESFSVLLWVTIPSQEVRIQLNKLAEVNQLVELRVFGDFQPEMTNEDVVARFGNPSQIRTDNFGGTWSKYVTPLGYVEVGHDRRTSAPVVDADKTPLPGRWSLQAFTDKPLSEILHPALLDVLSRAEKLTPRAEERELHVFDSHNELVLDIWLKKGRIDHMELFRHVDR